MRPCVDYVASWGHTATHVACGPSRGPEEVQNERETLLYRPLRQGHKPAPKGVRLEIYDTIVPGLMLRVTDTGAKSYAVNARWAGKAGKRTIGPIKRVSLKQARAKAREWLELAQQGKDPAELVRQARVRPRR